METTSAGGSKTQESSYSASVVLYMMVPHGRVDLARSSPLAVSRSVVVRCSNSESSVSIARARDVSQLLVLASSLNPASLLRR